MDSSQIGLESPGTHGCPGMAIPLGSRIDARFVIKPAAYPRVVEIVSAQIGPESSGTRGCPAVAIPVGPRING